MLIGAYYYPWYRGTWLTRTVRQSDPPTLGEYNNTIYDDALLEHMKCMRRAGIDFAAVSWDGRSTSYEHVMDAAKEEGMKMTVFYESLFDAAGPYQTIVRGKNFDNLLRNMEHLSGDLDDECWLRINGKPVVMLYVSRNFREPDYQFPEIRKALGEDTYLVGDEVFWGQPPQRERCKHFDAITTYNWYQPSRFSGNGVAACDSFLASVRQFLKTCEFDVPYWPVIMPGYNDTGVRPAAKHPPLPRENGYLFREFLKDAKSAAYDCVMVTSFNEWYEDSSVEPSDSWGNFYLDILRDE